MNGALDRARLLKLFERGLRMTDRGSGEGMNFKNLSCLGGIAIVGGIILYCMGSKAVLTGVFMVSVVALGGFFLTKTEGYGTFTVSTLVLLLSVIMMAILATTGLIARDDTTSILLAIIGFASGLFVGDRGKKD